MKNEKEYFAFISYQREDEEWAEWLQHQLEHYRLPSNIIEEHPELPHEVRPLFRDATELAGGVLVKEINYALENSLYLIVICSPNSAKSIWVNKEVQKFIDLGKLEYIIPFIVGGVPYAQTEEECYVPTLVSLKGKEQELLGINISEMGREVASIKVVARMLHLKFDSLWQRYEKEKEEERLKLIEINNRILRNQSRFIAEKVVDLVDTGDSYLARLLAMESLPKELDNPERPYVFEAEAAFRKAVGCNSFVLAGHTDRVNAATFSPDGTRIVSSSEDKTIRIWDVYTGVLIKSLTGHEDDVRKVGFLDDERLVSASSDNTVRIWDIVKGEQIKTLSHDMLFFTKMLFSPDAHNIAFIDGNTIEIMNVLNGTIAELPTRHKERITSAAFSQDGQQLVTASSDKFLIWDIEDERLVRTIKNADLDILRIAFDEDKKLMASFSGDNVMCIWDTNTAQLVRKIKYEILQGLEIVSFSPDFKYMVFSNYSGTIAMYDTVLGNLVGVYRGHSNSIESIMFSPNLKLMVSASRDKTIRVWDVETESADGIRLEMPQPINHISFSADGKRLVSSAADGTVSLIDAATCNVVQKFDSNGFFSKKTSITRAEFSPDGRLLVTASDKGKICIWDIVSGKLIKTIKGHKEAILSMSFSSDAKMIVTSASDKMLKVWDVATGEMIKELFVGDEARCVCIDADCSSIMAVLYRGSLLKWNFYKEDQIETVLCSQSNIISASFSWNKEYVATTQLLEHSFKIWSVGSGELVKGFEGHNTPVDSVAYSPDGRLLASASMDSTVIVWDVELGKSIVTFDGGRGIPCALSFSPNGRCIVLAKKNGSIRIWPFLSLQDLIDQTRERFKDRPLTPEERHQYYLE